MYYTLFNDNVTYRIIEQYSTEKDNLSRSYGENRES